MNVPAPLPVFRPVDLMKARGMELARVYAQEVVHGRTSFDVAKAWIVADVLAQAPLGARDVPGPEAVAAWADRALNVARGVYVQHGPQAFRRKRSGAPHPEEKAPMPDGNAARIAQPTVAPPSPRQTLIEASALESVAKLGLTPERAVAVARSAVNSMTDEQVRNTLDSLPERGWAMRADGTLAPPVPPADPMVALVERMRAEAGPLAQTHPSIVATVSALAEKVQHLGNTGLRTRVAWAVEDMEKALGRPLEMPPPLRAEVNDRAKTAPGLTNEGMKALLAETRGLRDPGLVSAIREAATKLARRPEAEQRAPEAVERVDRLAERVRVLRSPIAPAAAPTAPEQPPPAPVAQPVAKAASPGPGPQVPVPTAAPPVQGAAEGIARGQAMRAAGRAPPWDLAPPGPGMGARLAGLEGRIAQRLAVRDVSEATKNGDMALKALQRLASAGANPSVELRQRALAAVQEYGDARVRAGDSAASSKLDGERLAPLVKLDEQIARQAAIVPGVESGKTLLEELTGRAGEALREAAQRAAAAVAGAMAMLRPKPSPQPTAAPGP